MKTVLVLGALGGVGRVVAAAFVARGWRVLGLVRRSASDLPDGVMAITANLFDTQAVVSACGAVDVVFNGLNAPYPKWPTEALPLYSAAADVAEALGARHIYPGNVYNFGAAMPPELWPNTPFAPTTIKGRIRVQVEAMLRARADAGRLSTIVIRAGDFFGSAATKSWMNALVAKDLRKGVITAPGGFETVHAWAYLPDLAEVIVRLAEARSGLAAYEVFHFDSHNVSMRQLAEAARASLGRKVRLSRMPRFVFSLIAVFDPFMKSALEMLYLWDVPHALKDARLAQVIGPLPRTDLAQAMKSFL